MSLVLPRRTRDHAGFGSSFRQTRRRVIVASFASHVHRVQQIIDTAVIHNARLLVGRSMVRNMKIAQEMGYLTIPENLMIDSKELENYGDNVVLICRVAR